MAVVQTKPAHAFRCKSLRPALKHALAEAQQLMRTTHHAVNQGHDTDLSGIEQAALLTAASSQC